MLLRKAAVCAFVFTALLITGWAAERSIQLHRLSGLSLYAEEDGVSIIHEAGQAPAPVYRPREYVKILRKLRQLDELGPSDRSASPPLRK